MSVSRETSEDDLPGQSELASAIDRQARELGIELREQAAAALAMHLQAVLRRNESLNLTSIDDPLEAARLHVVDSLTLLIALQPPVGPALDIGSGGGFPGIPVALCSGIPVTLLEATRKKASFLAEVVELLGVSDQVQVVAQRAEEHALQEGASYATIMARAVAGLPSLVELSAPLMEPGARFVAMKGRLRLEERERGAEAARIVGLEESRVIRLELPAGGERRTIVVYERTGRPTVELPRRIGAAQKRPLA
ncbi:MAG: 16S rRNA (guanine(527)-N(7))-methyltransferase RsmG [Coriobacteriia bacterium]|nr:16S rRNA (guanine(527)-N(7))-methyltransferase RsmG [Coriobacteriia bacterium]